MNIIDDKVLLLNKNMTALRLISVRRAFFLLSKPRRNNPHTRVATVLDVDEHHEIVGPVKWDDWLARTTTENDRVVHTTKQAIKVPSIVILTHFDRVPLVTPNLNKATMWDRQKGKDIYTLENLQWDNCDIDHHIAKSKGGKKSWDNCGLTAIPNNRKKGSKTAAEVGFKLQIPLVAPPPKPLFVRLNRDPRFPEWNWFIKE